MFSHPPPAGELPASIGGLTALKVLGLRRNQFSGESTDHEPRDNMQAASLHIDSHKKISASIIFAAPRTGPFPEALVQLTALQTLNLSYNQFEGTNICHMTSE